MKKSSTINMTEGNPTLLLIAFAFPMLIGNLFQQAYNFADSIIVGRLIGADALAAVGATGSVSFLFFSICNGISSGGGIVTAQYFGAGDDYMTRRSIANSAYIMFVSALIMGLTAFFLAPTALSLMKTPPDIIEDAIIYMKMSALGVPLVAVYNYSSSMLRALGDSKTPLYFLIISCIINVILDIVFIQSFHMNVFGAALATIVSQIISGIGCLIFAFRRNPYFRITRQEAAYSPMIVKKAVKIGLPLAMQWSLVAVSTTALQIFINGFETVAVAAFTATSRIEQLVHQPYGSLSGALSTYAGQNYGANRMDRVKLGLKRGIIMSFAFSIFMLIVIQLFSTPIASIFVDEKDVIEIAAKGLRLTSWFYVFLATIYMTRGILNGVGDAMFAFINGIVEVSCRIGLPMLFFLIPSLGIWSIWWTAGLTWTISAFFCGLRYYAWNRKKKGI